MVHYFLNLFLTKYMLYLVHTYVGERGFPGIIKFFPFFLSYKTGFFPPSPTYHSRPSLHQPCPQFISPFSTPLFFLFYEIPSKIFQSGCFDEKELPQLFNKLVNSFFKKKFISFLVVNLEKIYYFCKVVTQTGKKNKK